MGAAPRPGLRVGELSRRTGVSAQLLRAWERRYGLFAPARSAGGYRLYAEADERRVRRMQAYLARGLSAAEAARAALSADPPASAPAAGSPGLANGAAALARCLDAFDEPAAQAALDRLLADFTVESVLGQAILPYLHDLYEVALENVQLVVLDGLEALCVEKVSGPRAVANNT